MWFIDSSKRNEGSSASINGIRPTKDLFMSMEKYPIVFQAEITAISEPCREHLVQDWECHEVICILGGWNKVRLVWVPGHSGQLLVVTRLPMHLPTEQLENSPWDLDHFVEFQGMLLNSLYSFLYGQRIKG